jgi:hypothetical protein
MPPILDLQKRARELGRIRIGQVVPTTRKDGSTGTRPEKLDRFRLTSNSKPLLDKVAELYGGTVAEWAPQGGGAKAWEVVTNTVRIPIMVPPEPITQWYEFWTAGGCKHRCDGQRNVLTDEPCDPEDSAHQEAIKKPTTRLNVVLRDVEGIGVWRLESHGFNAAMELPDAAAFLAAAGGYVNGWVSLEPRTSKAEVADRQNGGTKIETRHFMVPIIEIDVTPAELMAGKGRVAAPSMIGGPVGETPALAAAGPDYVALAAELTTPDQVRDLWRQAAAAGHLTMGLADHFTKRAAELGAAAADPPATAAATAAASSAVPDEDGVVDAEIVEEDADKVWSQIVETSGRLDWSTTALHEDFKKRMGMPADVASAAELGHYLGLLEAEVQAA